MSERTKLYSAASIGSFDLTLILNGGDETRVRERCKFIKEDPNSQTLFNKSYGHKTEEASIYAQFHSLKQVPKPPISLDIEHFASGDFSYLGPFFFATVTLGGVELCMTQFPSLNFSIFNLFLAHLHGNFQYFPYFWPN